MTSSVSVVSPTNLSIKTGEVRQELLDELEDLEDRHVERDDHRPDNAAEERDHEWLDQCRQRLGRRLDLLVVKLGDLLEHGVERTSVLTHGHHLDDHGWKHRVLEQRLA